MSNRIVEELIKKSKAASIKNRGMYPVTIATNVYKQDGTSMETVPNQEILEPDVIINPNDPEATPISEVVASIESGAVISVSNGEIAEELNLDKGIVLQGVNAGIAQNYKQEV